MLYSPMNRLGLSPGLISLSCFFFKSNFIYCHQACCRRSLNTLIAQQQFYMLFQLLKLCITRVLIFFGLKPTLGPKLSSSCF
jgi:hypothetical protein